MTKHLSADDRREQVAEILVTGMFRVLADRASRKRPPGNTHHPDRIEVAAAPEREVEGCR